MEIRSRFDHFNINVTDLDRSLAFYGKALGLKEVGRKQAADGSFTLVYLGDGETGFRLSLRGCATIRGLTSSAKTRATCVCASRATEAVRAFHREMGCICFENHDMGLYFIADPDDYWIEILPFK